MRSFSVLFMAVAFVSTISVAVARPFQPWSDNDLMEKSDLVVLATFESSKDSSDFPSGKDPVIGVTTTFLVDGYIKGRIEGQTQFMRIEGKPKRKIKLRHYRYVHPESNIRVVDGPSLVRFDGQPRQYILYLKTGHDDVYEPVSGQSDPVFSVRVVAPYTHPEPLPAKPAEPAPPKK